MAEPRLSVAYDALWPAFKQHLRELLSSYQLGVLRAGSGETFSMDAFVHEALIAQGRWLALQDVLGLISQLEEAEREGRLGEEDADADDGRGAGATQARHRRGQAPSG